MSVFYRRSRLACLAAITVLAALLGSVDPSAATTLAPATPAPTVPAAQEGRAAAGRQVYLQNYCGICHSLAAAGTRGTFGPPHDGLATTARQRLADPAYTGEAMTVVQYLRESIVLPGIYASPGYAHTSHPMPAYAHLPKRDLDALIYFLLQQK
jgi:mono/diheme cytochrome c family protein